MKIKVTEKEISTATKTRCPIELAFSREGFAASVTRYRVAFHTRGACLYNLPLPPTAGDFVRAFDANLPVSPFEFEMQIPADLLEPVV